ncbi:MAG: VOC family protein [Solirubrobacteraceae bacterium]
MSERTSYEPGTPSWVDLSTPDLEGALRFYGGLFGWELEDAGFERARELGGELLGEPMDSPYGRWAPVRDPQGGVFRLIRGATTQ